MIKLLSVAVRFTKELGWYGIVWTYWIAKLSKEFLVFFCKKEVLVNLLI